jgi:7-cyano-7-deazaguanine tRNA-ribosyltransferase
MDEKEKKNMLALHNLISIKSEVERVKDAIFEGRLWEYVMKKARSHPKLFETIECFTENPNYFLKSTPKFKEKAIFLFSKEDQFRPEVVRFHDLVRRFRTKKKTVVILPEPNTKPAYLAYEYKIHSKKYDRNAVQFCSYNPYLGIIPIEISDIYPASHYVMANPIKDPNEFTLFGITWKTFFKNNQFNQIHYNKRDYFLSYFVESLPKRIKRNS